MGARNVIATTKRFLLTSAVLGLVGAIRGQFRCGSRRAHRPKPQATASCKDQIRRPRQPRPARASSQIDRERYRASPLMSNGTVGPMLQLRDLFRQFLNELRVAFSGNTSVTISRPS
jgi:hypothetical protein